MTKSNLQHNSYKFLNNHYRIVFDSRDNIKNNVKSKQINLSSSVTFKNHAISVGPRKNR